MMIRVVVDEFGARRSLVVGFLVTLVAAASLLLTAKPAHAKTFTVNTTSDDSGDGACNVSECTLREAIDAANDRAGADTINFNIPGDGPHTIVPSTGLPAITDPVTIDGYSQPGSKPNTLATGNNAVLKIELSGANPGAGAVGLRISDGASNSTIKGLVINRWGGTDWGLGVSISGSEAKANKVEGNLIGTDVSGTQDLGNAFAGVDVGSSNNTIGGTTAAARNLISGNDWYDVYIWRASGNKVQGNFIGTDASGTLDRGDSQSGVYIQDAPNTTVGGTTAAARNVISGNKLGVNIVGSEAKGNLLQGNFIGTDASGTQDLGNSWDGVRMENAPNNTIGGTASWARNVISGNGGDGVNIYGSEAKGNKVEGNRIGTRADETGDLGNAFAGVDISGSNNTVGGTVNGARNVISGNDTYGVHISGSEATLNKVEGNVISANGDDGVIIASGATGNASGNRVLSNFISSNGGLGINLLGGTEDAFGVTTNDTDDLDTGPSNLQNFPEITSAKPTKKGKKLTTIAGALNSTPDTTFTVQFFSNPSDNPDEGKRFIGQRSVQTDGEGNASFTITVARSKAPVGSAVTATATDSGGNTSEFSAPKTVIQSS